MKKPKNWDGSDLKGVWQVTLKLDGYRAKIVPEVGAFSFTGKPFYGLDDIVRSAQVVRDVEVFCGSLDETASILRSHNPARQVREDEVFDLDPICERLIIKELVDPTAVIIREELFFYMLMGEEGVVLRQGDVWIKVKSNETHDVKIIGLLEGKNSNKGKLGAFITEKGRVGIGFTKEDRDKYWDEKYIGKMIEVDCMRLTKSGKFRHAKFVRERFDKDE